MKKCYLIYNKQSGKAKKKNYIPIFEEILSTYGYETTTVISQYKEHVIKIVKELPNNIDLVISVGGDGTFNELVRGNYERSHRLVLGHIPMGTTNDIGIMLGFGKNPKKNLKLLLEGVNKRMDICLINNHPFVYVAGFGNYTNIPYDTNRKMKARIGYLAYLYNAFKDVLKKHKLYDIEFEVNKEINRGLYSFMLITNATRIGGVKLFDNIKLDDDQFEVLFCSLNKRTQILRALYYLAIKNVTNVPGLYFYKSNKLKMKIESQKSLPWCIDGEKLDVSDKEVNITIDKKTTIRVPKTKIKDLFIK